MTTAFDDLSTALASGGADAAFERLAQTLIEQNKPHELFDARLMQGRRRLGLPIAAPQGIDELPEEVRTAMENVYLDACREVGRLLLDQRRLQEAWMYLRPVGDKALVAQAIESVEPSDERLEELVGLAVHEGIHPRLGFELVLKHYGICNAISRFDGTMHERPIADRRSVAALLVGRLHADLLSNLKADAARQSGSPPDESTIGGIVEHRDWMFAEHNYHIDTSHLNAVVRFARLLVDAEPLRQAIDLTEYGRRLSRQYQFPGEEPFVDVYPAHALLFRATVGEQVDEALAYFRERAQNVSLTDQGTASVEVYIALLARLGRNREALDAMVELLPTGVRTTGFAPSMMELARASGEYARFREICRDRGDLLGYAAGLVEG